MQLQPPAAQRRWGRTAASLRAAGGLAPQPSSELGPRLGVGIRLVLPETLEFGLASNCRLTLFAPAASVPSFPESYVLAWGRGSGRELAADR